MSLEIEETSLLIWGQGLESILYLLIRPNSPEYFVMWEVFMHISFHVELGQVVLHNFVWIMPFEFDFNQLDIFQSYGLHFGVPKIQ